MASPLPTRNGDAVGVARVAGIAMLSLGLACLPAPGPPGEGPAALRALLTYNVLVAVYLGYLGALRDVYGLALWPAVALHAVLAALLAWSMRTASARPA